MPMRIWSVHCSFRKLAAAQFVVLFARRSECHLYRWERLRPLMRSILPSKLKARYLIPPGASGTDSIHVASPRRKGRTLTDVLYR